MKRHNDVISSKIVWRRPLTSTQPKAYIYVTDMINYQICTKEAIIWYCIVTCQMKCQFWYIMMEYSDSVCYLQSVPKQHYVTEKSYNMYQKE